MQTCFWRKIKQARSLSRVKAVTGFKEPKSSKIFLFNVYYKIEMSETKIFSKKVHTKVLYLVQFSHFF